MSDGKDRMDIREYGLDELKQFMESLGEKTFRAKQAYEWLHKKLATSVDEMTDLPKSLRETLKDKAVFRSMDLVEKRDSKITDTCKYLFQLHDGNRVESVSLRYGHGLSVCISSQVGCRMGCAFCASGFGGLVRNLEAAEMLSQVYEISKDVGERVSNVIIMGIGEPLDNYEAVLRFIRILTNEDGQNLSQRNVTISTCGILKQIKRLANERLPITLAISLHAPNDGIRKSLMAVARQYTMDELLNVCREYANVTGRRITFEYAMIRGVNDRNECAEELSERLRSVHCHVNLIPFNEVKEGKYQRSEEKRIQDFKKILEKNRINVTIRRRMGEDILAACGQLRRSHPSV